MKFIFSQIHKILLLIILLILNSCSENNNVFNLKIMSYNVRHGVSMNWKPSIERQAKIISSQNPHWVGLQEIDHIFFKSTKSIEITPVYIKVLNEPEASDRRPVVAELQIKIK